MGEGGGGGENTKKKKFVQGKMPEKKNSCKPRQKNKNFLQKEIKELL